MVIFATVLAVLLLIWTSLIYLRLHVPGLGIFVLLYKSFAAAFSLLLGAIGLVGAVLGALGGSVLVAVAYVLLAVAAGIPALRVMTAPEAISWAFGSPWPAERREGERFAVRRRGGIRLGGTPEPRWHRDIPFWTPLEPTRPLLCDIWQPAAEVTPSGLAFIYFHGSGWTILDKDCYTRTLFRHLTAQGHVVMDVAYRLFPESDIEGMVGDVRRSVAWLRSHAAEYRINPDRIVIGGASAGGHIAMLASYTEGMAELTPPELRGVDTSVRGVVAWYGPVDLAACFRHYEVDKLIEKMPAQPDWNAPMPPMMRRMMGKDAERFGMHKASGTGRLDWMLGGTPGQVPERYALLSPITHVHAGCPPTLLMQGEDDLIVPAGSTRQMYQKLCAAGVKAACLVLPHTDHAFDLFGTNWSPAARQALWHTERFLAHMAE
ncbi:MAG TPA: alpha/beta hydrolase [Symbiobacteriaceae bacterium]|nr:alpha/beta hydrolase [Symbiobacteriaceae bacterium]